MMHHVTPAYVDLAPQALEGVVRFSSKEQKEDFLAALDNVKQMEIKGRNIEFQAMSDQEEIEYFSKINRKRLKLKSKIAAKAQKAQQAENIEN